MQAGAPPTVSTHAEDAAPLLDLLRSTREDGSVDPAFRAALADGVALYRHMLTLRLVSARMIDLQRNGKVASHASCLGEEAVIVAATLAARANDWVFPGVREWGAAIVRGLPIADYMHHAFGSARDPAKGHSAPDHPPARAFRVAPASGIAGAHVPQAVGAAWAAKIRKDDVATIAIFGDAATSAGDIHNGLNFAGVFKPACVFVARKDGRSRNASRAVAVGGSRHEGRGERALAYGIASASVDGSDALAVLTVVREALARAAAGKGATLLEAVTHPILAAAADGNGNGNGNGNGTSALHRVPADAWARGGAELLALGEADPLSRLRRVLEREKLLDAAAGDAMLAEVRAAVDAAVAAAEQAGPPATSTLFDDVYAEVPAHLRAQKESSPWRR